MSSGISRRWCASSLSKNEVSPGKGATSVPMSRLSVGMMGDEVSALHDALARAGLKVPEAEVERRFFGPGTRRAVQRLQRRHGLEATGEVDDATAARLGIAPPIELARSGPAPRHDPRWADRVGTMPPLEQSPMGSNDLARLGRAYVAFGAGLWRSAWDINRQYAGHVTRYATQAISGQLPGVETLSRDLAFGAMSYAGEIASVLPVELDGLSRRLDADARELREPPPPRFDSRPPSPRTHVVEGVPVVFPVRIFDASQGFAVYFVDVARLQRHLDERGDPFVAVDLGSGRTPLSIMGVDYRQTDLGVYFEIGVCALVRPRGLPTETPGTLFLSLTVSDQFNIPRASALWGYSKTLAPEMAFTYHRDAVHVAIDARDPTALAVSLPRVGTARSRSIPRYTWGVRDGTPCKMVIARSGSGEGMQVGGNVALTLGDGTQARCVCRLGATEWTRRACVCLLLRDLGLPRRAAANTWSESMWADCSESVCCPGGAQSLGKVSR